MTGYGQASGKYEDKSYVVEIKSLNGKTSDIRCKLPGTFKEKEMILRKNVLSKGFRGKFDFSIVVESSSGDEEYGLNKDLFKNMLQNFRAYRKSLILTEIFFKLSCVYLMW